MRSGRDLLPLGMLREGQGSAVDRSRVAPGHWEKKGGKKLLFQVSSRSMPGNEETFPLSDFAKKRTEDA